MESSNIAFSRNDPRGFAARTRINLEIIEQTFAEKDSGHVVTQLILSLLGLIVFPIEQDMFRTVAMKQLRDTDSKWVITPLSGPLPKKPPRFADGTVGNLLIHLRNAIAHSRVRFLGDADSRHLENVIIRFQDARLSKDLPYWQAQVKGGDLRGFCSELLDFFR